MTSTAETIAAKAAEHARRATAGQLWRGADAVPPPAVGRPRVEEDRLLAGFLHAAVRGPHLEGRVTPVGLAGGEVATVLWTRYLKYDAADPGWPDRDRFIVSSGHDARLHQALLHLTGHPGCDPDASGQSSSLVVGTGAAEPLGHGLGMAVGMALAERLLAARFGRSLVDHRTWVISCAGDLAQGISHEAASLAAHMHLERLTVLWDTAEADLGQDTVRRFASYGWATRSVDAQDHAALASALGMAMRSRKPTLIACRGQPEADFGRRPASAALLQWAAARWLAAGQRGSAARRSWLKRLAHSSHRAEFERAISGEMPACLAETLDGLKSAFAARREVMTTSAASERVMLGLAAAMPELVGGTTGPGERSGLAAAASTVGSARRVLQFDIREHGMAVAMNGMAAHGGMLPYGGTTGLVPDAIRPAVRFAALMRRRVVHVLTHDARRSGKGGPAHLPVEQLASLRVVPNLQVLRPADAIETAECWELALRRHDGPSLLVLGCDSLPVLRSEASANRCAEGGYVLAEAEGPRRATLIATGSEVALAMAARARLAAERIAVAVVSLPSWDLFARIGAVHQARVLGDAMRFGIEAGTGFGWERWLGPDGVFMGIEDFATSPELSAEAIVMTVRRCLAA